jgi:hypothetical protein
MPFSIDAFRANMDGLMPDNRFEVSFGLPNGLRGGPNAGALMQEAGRARITCEAAPLPGTTLLTLPVRRYGYGYQEPRPFSANFTGANMIFRGDVAGRVYDLIHAWQMCAVNTETRDGLNGVTGPLQNNHHPWELGYIRDYAVDVTVTAFDQGNNVAAVSILRDAFPVQLADIGMSWASRNQYMRIAVTFAYSDWYRDQSLF